MGRTLNRTAAFTALGRALTAGARGGPPLGARLAALPRMMWATITGRYDGAMRLALMAAATAYVASPIDLVPELALFLVGLIDDAVVIAWLAGAILAETERFIEWDARQRSVIRGHVV
jgi:uncharacterized membrane protein YkvA (DUF1232 family)